MLKYGLIACFRQVIKAPTTVNISSTAWFGKNWELENGKKIEVLAFQKVAKTGKIGKKVQCQAISIM